MRKRKLHPEQAAAFAYPVQFLTQTQAAERSIQALNAKHPKFSRDMVRELDTIKGLRAPLEVKLQRMYVLADNLAKQIAPFAVCKSGCAQCCRTAVQMSQVESDWMGDAIGMPAAKVPPIDLLRIDPDIQERMAARWFGHPCPFLKDDRCSIYAHRPLPCRLYYNVGMSNFFCDTAVLPNQSFVTSVDVNLFWETYSALFWETGLGDIREFFGKAP